MLFIETYVREDMIRLYGFAVEAEREWFRLLMTVQGVGAKVALAVLGVLAPAELANAIAARDLTAIARAPGVGKRVAERIAGELKDKAPGFTDADPAALRLAGEVAEYRVRGPAAEAVSALVNLGYAQLQASAAVAAAAREAGEEAPTEKLIRLGLRELAR
ncbi:Holliday junction ATP-dependent DNA helicase RuvA [Methylobrevis pamukkalensis]|uniref:Holliday junction branch migration complex subunit RuvA n=1 Tax=Methylobrevis pamukkalensis TaxID=1439726 RepID=A0A1E3H156_9HYPH|nr:Holliday junction ATP-dependent DNA helicase RuvA [Methylobrevis pamukkalensis]